MRAVEVAPQRLARWLVGFEQRHGHYCTHVSEGAVHLRAADGERARLSGWLPVTEDLGETGVTAALFAPPWPMAVLLVRRGGYAVAIADAGGTLSRKVGTRHVQSRTAAGGWSQQRYARRRGNQAAELVGAVAAHLARLLEEAAQPPASLLVGGSRDLVAQVLADRRLFRLQTLPRRSLHDLPDPRAAVLETALERAQAVRIMVG